MAFTVSISFSDLCNYRCEWCYLTPEQLKDKTRLTPQHLYDLLSEISSNTTITHIDLYGGEITLLSESYVLEAVRIIRLFFGGQISIITNLSSIPSWLYSDEFDVSVSWDYIERARYQDVLANMALFNKPFHVLTLVTKNMVNWSDQTMLDNIAICNTISNITSVELKPYSSSKANRHDVSFIEYEHFVKRWIELSQPNTRQYEFVTERKIVDVLNGNGHSWSDDHLYIIPSGHLAVLDFDSDDREYFSEIFDWHDYLKWTFDEYYKVNLNTHCGACTYRGKCLSEHLRDVHDLDANSCSGFYSLLEWYRNTK